MESSVASPPNATSLSGLVRLIRDDITLLDVDGFVFYAEPDLALGSGFGGAISVRGGPAVQKELNELAKAGPIPMGEVVVSGAGKLKARRILHTVGPRFREAETETKLFKTVIRCLEVAQELGLRSLAFPAMGSGYYGIPPAVSARVMLEAFQTFRERMTSLETLIICVFDTPQYQAFEAAMAAQG